MGSRWHQVTVAVSKVNDLLRTKTRAKKHAHTVNGFVERVAAVQLQAFVCGRARAPRNAVREVPGTDRLGRT